ncbi:MAG: hypothetical protein Q8N74_05400 [Sulfuricella sp.]|nr:hypothetical protein [Sulfuricella sp.]
MPSAILPPWHRLGRATRALGIGSVIEIKRSLAPKGERGFYAACADLKPAKKFVVYPGQERYRLAEDIEAISLVGLAQEIHD